MLRLARRAVRGLWKRRRWTVPLGTLLVLWSAAGFLPALAPFDWLIWGIAAIGLVGLFGLYAMYRVAALQSATSRHIARNRRSQRQQQKRLVEATARIARLEREKGEAAAINAELLRRVRQLEEATAERQVSAGRDGIGRP